MAKFSGASSVRAAQKGNLSDLTLPTGQQDAAPTAPQEEAPTPQSPLLQELSAYQQQEQAAPVEQEIQQTTDEALLGQQAEVERQSIPSLSERGQGGPRVDRWLKPPVPAQSTASTADGNLRGRAKAISSAVSNGALTISAKGIAARGLEKQGVEGPALAESIGESRHGDILAAMSRVNAVQYDPTTDTQVPDPVYAQIASAVVENNFGNTLLADTTPSNEIDFQTDEEAAAGIESGVGPQEPQQQLTHAAGNSQLGQQISQEYQRMKGVQVPEKIPTKDAEVLGAAFKHLWSEQNPNLVKRTIDPDTNQWVYQLTAEGEKNLKDGEADRKRLFPKQNVRPAKIPLVKGKLPGDVGQNVVRDVSGAVGKPQFGKVLQQGMENLGQVPNVVDKTRSKILLATILPVLRDGSHETWQAEINNIGPGKVQKFQAALAQQEKARAADPNFNEEVYSPEENMAALVDKIAQEVRSVAQERKGANYLSYNIQGFQGRVTPQQSFFNPTTSKAVRFVTRNATPSMAKPGSRVEKNLRQMYAMMLLPKNLKADVDLPTVREQKLKANEVKLEQWGDKLNAAVEASMTDAQYEAVSQAIEEGVPLTDPNFPQFGGLELDPNVDAELIKHIESKGEDGPHTIDGLIDFSKYIKAKRQGRPHASYFNAYMDGKTNGLASNGIQMGHIDTAERTGVLREGRKTLLDSGDIRDELQRLAIDSISEGWDGNTDAFETELNEVAREVYGHRDLNKMTTMTFGYGKETDSFVDKMEETIALKSESLPPDHPYHEALKVVEQNLEPGELAKTLNNKYDTSLRSVMSEEALAARALMRSAAALHAATDKLFSIKGPTGMDINLGRDVSEGYETAELSTYRLGDEKTKVAHYQSTPTSAAAKTRENAEGQIESTPGEFAYGGSVVAPVQAMDAATVGLTASGRSWDRLKSASGGNPYMHTIYDAFKVDANGYDVVLEEVNKNWLNTGMKWSYLEQTYNATQDKMKEFQQEISKRDPKEPLKKGEGSYMQWLLTTSETKSGKQAMMNFVKKMGRFKEYKTDNEVWDDAKMMANEMKKVGYNIYSPPENPTVGQLKHFMGVFSKQLNLRGRMSSTIERTNNNKKRLKAEILKKGYKTPSGERIALQYYAH